MSKQVKKFITKVLLLSTSLVLIFNLGNFLINANKTDTHFPNEPVTNYSNFKNVDNNSSIGKTGVAITTNIGIKYKQRKDTPATIYRDIFSVSEVMINQSSANREMIGNNMIAIEEYRNVLKTDIKQLVNSSYDRSRILNAFIEQLEFRYVVGAQNIKKLNEQKSVFLSTMESSNTKIESLKQKIESDFKSNDSQESLANIDTYLELKKEYYYARTYIVYINHFLNEYTYLSNYNKQLLDTLINNKEAIIKNAYIVLPDTGTDLLRKFDLIYSEEELKK